MYPNIYINRSVVQAGKLEEKMGELKQEVVEANKSVNSLQKELQMSLAGAAGKPLALGVPYGSKCERDLSGENATISLSY